MSIFSFGHDFPLFFFNFFGGCYWIYTDVKTRVGKLDLCLRVLWRKGTTKREMVDKTYQWLCPTQSPKEQNLWVGTWKSWQLRWITVLLSNQWYHCDTNGHHCQCSRTSCRTMWFHHVSQSSATATRVDFSFGGQSFTALRDGLSMTVTNNVNNTCSDTASCNCH